MDAISLSVTYFAILLGFGVLIANVLKKRHIPDTFFLLLLGLAFSPTVGQFITQFISIELMDISKMGNIPDFLRLLALILVVFTGTYNLNFKLFKRYSSVSLKLAFVGVIMNTVFLGMIAHFMFGIDFVFAMLLGAAVSGTGSGVVFAFHGALSKSRRALTILKVESIFNSPISVLVPLIFLDLVYLTPGAMIAPMDYLAQFWLMVTAGVGTGLIIGLAISFILKGVMGEYSSLLLFSIALITYALALSVGGSGMLAVAICGLVAGNFSFGREKKEKLIRFEDQLSELLRISVFTLFGASVTLLFGLQELALIIIFFLIVVLLRPVFVMLMLSDLRKRFGKIDRLLLSFIAPRGLPAAAMIPIIATAVIAAGQPAIAETMINIVFMVILLSVMFSTLVAGIASMERFQHEEEEPEKKLERKAKKGKPGEEEKPEKEEMTDDLFLMIEETRGQEDTRG